MRTTITSILFLLLCSGVNGQSSSVELVNTIVAKLIGEQEVEDIPVYKDMNQVCGSGFISCNDQAQIIGMDFPFSNLNGNIPSEITQLQQLEWLNFQFNYLAGALPEGFAELKNLEMVKLRGNFITGPLPADLLALKSEAEYDLSENAIAIDDEELIYLLNIKDQVNLEGCRSPDSIYISDVVNARIAMDEEIEILLDDIETETIPEEDNEVDPEDEEFKVVEVMPRFPGCENLEIDDMAKKKCADERMLQYIYKRLRYPMHARANDVEGMVVTQFVVTENGQIADVRLLRDPGARLGNAAQWIVNRMNYICEPWSPGIQRGKPVKVQYTLPVKFKLQ